MNPSGSTVGTASQDKSRFNLQQCMKPQGATATRTNKLTKLFHGF
jgi:hypothetical protein